MNAYHIVALAFVLVGSAGAGKVHADEGAPRLHDLRWSWRVVLAFRCDRDERMRSLGPLVAQLECRIRERDVAVYVVGESTVDALSERAPALADASAAELRARFYEQRGGSQMVLIGKDGGVKARASSARELERFLQLIDTMPMRRAEMRARAADCD